MKKLTLCLIMVCCMAIATSGALAADDSNIFLVHLKTSLKKDDAQICVAYNIMWAALEEGKKVKVLVDADAINTYKIGWSGKDDIEAYKIPENLRSALSHQFEVGLENVPKTYGDFLTMLNEHGVEFYINAGFLIVSKIGSPGKLMDKVSAKFFKPITLKEMVRMRIEAAYYMAY